MNKATPPAMIRRGLLTLVVLALIAGRSVAQDIANEPRREKWQRVPALFDAIGVRQQAVIADVGAGAETFKYGSASAWG